MLWLQDFPIDEEALRRLQTNAPLSTNIDDDGLACPFREQLAYFCRIIDPSMSTRLFDLLKGVDCRGHKATLIMSVPRRELVAKDIENLDGHRGLREALKSYKWPVAARDAPITCVQGSLGNVLMEGNAWIRGVWRSLTADGRHGARPLELGTSVSFFPLISLHFISIMCVQRGVFGRDFDGGKAWIRGVWRSLTADGRHGARPLELS